MAVKWSKDNWKKGDIWVQMSSEEVNKFHQAINDMVAKTQSTFKKVCRNMARDVARAALAKTGIAPKARLLRKADSEEYWVRIKNRFTGEEVVFPASAEKCAKYGYPMVEEVTNRGFMKSGWVSILQKLGVTGLKDNGYVQNTKWGQVTQNDKSNSSFQITVFQNVPFLVEWDEQRNKWKTPQHIVERSLVEVSNFWNDVLNYFKNQNSFGKDAFRQYTDHLVALAKKENQKYEILYDITEKEYELK